MRRVVVSILLILVIGISCVSCQKTPEKSVVADKSQGLDEKSIIPGEKNKVPKDLGIPEHWDETIIRRDGLVTLTADYDITIADIYNTPVYVYEIQTMNQEFLEKLCASFSKGDSLYEDPDMTKGELTQEKDKIAAGVGNWGYYDQNYINAMIGRVEALIEKAPEQKAEQVDKEVGLAVPQKSGMEHIDRFWANGTHRRPWHDWYYETDKKVGFTARIDRGRELNPIVRAAAYNNEVGSTTAFVYRQGTFIDENELELEWTLADTLDNGNKEYLNGLSNKMEQIKDDTFTKEDALKEADRVLADLSVKGFAVVDCVKAIGDTDSESWAGLEADSLHNSTGYAVYLSRKAGDVTGYPLSFAARPYEELAETMYASSFMTEEIRIIVTKEGIQLFEWTDISKRKDILAENTKLLTFDKIKEKLADHLLYTRVSSLGDVNPEGFTNTYTVKNVQLRAANINAYEDPEAAWLVPVWVFDVEGVMTYTSTEETTESKLGPETVVLNAIDGGFVQVQFDW